MCASLIKNDKHKLLEITMFIDIKSYINKLFMSVKNRGGAIVIRQFIARLLLLYAPLSLYSKIVLPLRAFLLIGYFPNVKTPTTFNEKILHRRAYRKDPRASLIADKWAVRQYIEDKGLKSILNEVYCVTDNPDEIDFEKLPDKFVIKVNYGSGKNIIVNDKSKLQIDKVISKCRYWINEQESILKRATEIHYRDIEPKIIIEKYLDELDDFGLKDYKFWCFHGKAEYVNVQFVRNGTRLTAMFDRNWNLQPFSTGNKPFRGVSIPKPQKYIEMVETAEKLCDGFDYLRIDLYCINDKDIIFGEMTYNSGGGLSIFLPRKYDRVVGELLKLEALSDN